MAHHQEMLKTLRASGHRLTPQRESVLAVVAESTNHLTAEEILGQVRIRYPYLNKSAVYRSLDLLTELGFVTQTDLGQGRVQYELHRHPHHHHLICKQCRRIQQIDHSVFVALRKRLLTEYGFQPDLDHFAIFGLCGSCSKKQASPRPKNLN